MVAVTTVDGSSFSQDSEEISSLLQSIPKCNFINFTKRTTSAEEQTEVGEVEEGLAKGGDVNVVYLREPSDSSFRVRRISRSFSISAGGKSSIDPPPEPEEELFCTNSNLNEQEKKSSNFILLRRSRSLGHIFLPNLFYENGNRQNRNEQCEDNNTEKGVNDDADIVVDDGSGLGLVSVNTSTCGGIAVKANAEQAEVDELTEEVEALEIEVLQEKEEDTDQLVQQASSFKTKASFNPSMINRPQTSPPTLIRLNEKTEMTPPEPAPTKMTILDKMQKSLGFFFRCARRDSLDDDNVISFPTSSLSTAANLKTTTKTKTKNGSAAKKVTVPFRSRTPEDKKSNSKFDDEIPMHKIDGSAFITKIDESTIVQMPSIQRPALPHRPHSPPPRLPQFYDVVGPKGPLLSTIHPMDFGKKCLVLDLDETLVHSTFHVPEAHDLIVPLGLPDGSVQNIYVAKRPGVDEFLMRACELFEVVIFTASLSRYADPVIDFLIEGMTLTSKQHATSNNSLYIRHRLYRESCLFLQGLYVKDLSRLGRALEHTVIVDNSPASFILQPDHGIPIKSWFNDTSDLELSTLMDSLTILARSENVWEWKRECSSTAISTSTHMATKASVLL